MELRHYWNIVWRRLPIVLALPLLVGLGSLALFLLSPATYTAQAKVQIVRVPPQAGDDRNYRYDEYYNFLATEFTADDLTEVMNGNVFADAVARTLRGPAYNLSLRDEEVRGAFTVRRSHRVLLINASASDRGRALAIARAAAETVRQDPLRYFARGDSGAPVQVVPLEIHRPEKAQSNRVQGLLNVALQTILAFFAGIGLAFLLDYLDERLRGAEETDEALGLPILGLIPANGRTGRLEAVAGGPNGRGRGTP